MSAALVYMMLDANTGLLRACEYVGRYAFRHDYMGDLPINDVAWFAKTPWRCLLLFVAMFLYAKMQRYSLLLL